MGIFVKTDKTKKEVFIEEESFDESLRKCLRCKYFFGRDNRCIKSKCFNEKKQATKEIPPKCVGCPYRKSEGYCFPCMKDLLEK